MGVAIYIVTDQDVEAVDTFVNGKALGHAAEAAVDSICAQAGLKSLYEYVSQNPEELQDLLDDLGGDMPDELPEEQWFKPGEGLQWAAQLATFLRANPNAINDSEAIIEDLDDYAEVFEKLQEYDVQWHFAVDF